MKYTNIAPPQKMTIANKSTYKRLRPVYICVFVLKHNFCYGKASCLPYSGVFDLEKRPFENGADPVLVWKLRGCVSV